MKKRALILLLAAAMAFTAAACAKKAPQNSADNSGEEEPASVEETSEGSDEESEIPDSEYGLISEGAKWGYNIEGSAVYLEGKTVIVTVAVDSEDNRFAPGEVDTMKKNTRTALDFITQQASEYGKTAEFVFDEEGLDLTYDYDDDVEEFEYDDYDSILEELISEKLDTQAILSKYSADGIAYLFYLNGTGDSFASPHWYEDEEYYFNEGAYVFKTSYDDSYDEVITGPNVYAYELLQLFGALPLDYPDAYSGYTATLLEAVLENYNNDVMLGYLEADGTMNEEEVTREITEITAYTLGLVDSFDELETETAFTKTYKASFVDNYDANTNGGADTSAYEYVPSFEEPMTEEDDEEEEEEEEGEEITLDLESADPEEADVVNVGVTGDKQDSDVDVDESQAGKEEEKKNDGGYNLDGQMGHVKVEDIVVQ